MILEKNFIQIQHDEATKYVEKTTHRYATEEERVMAFNAYIQGRVEAVADFENLATMYNKMLKEKNALVKQLEKYKDYRDAGAIAIPKEDEGLGL